MLGWFTPELRERRQKIRLDRRHLERRARRFLQNYIVADEALKARYYQTVHKASSKCRPVELAGEASGLDDARHADATATAAMTIVRLLEERNAEEGFDKGVDFVIDGYATVGVAYRRASGIYVGHSQLQALGTAAVHLLTMATSYAMSKDGST